MESGNVSNRIIHSVICSKWINTDFASIIGMSELYESLLERAIDKYFSVSNTSDTAIENITKWIVKYYNFVCEMYKDDFNNPQESKSWIVTPWGFYGITCFASMIMSSPSWKEITECSLSYVNWEDKSLVSGIVDNIEINMLKVFKEACCYGVQRRNEE